MLRLRRQVALQHQFSATLSLYIDNVSIYGLRMYTTDLSYNVSFACWLVTYSHRSVRVAFSTLFHCLPTYLWRTTFFDIMKCIRSAFVRCVGMTLHSRTCAVSAYVPTVSDSKWRCSRAIAAAALIHLLFGARNLRLCICGRIFLVNVYIFAASGHGWNLLRLEKYGSKAFCLCEYGIVFRSVAFTSDIVSKETKRKAGQGFRLYCIETGYRAGRSTTRTVWSKLWPTRRPTRSWEHILWAPMLVSS
jgi:hypothetical protein